MESVLGLVLVGSGMVVAVSAFFFNNCGIVVWGLEVWGMMVSPLLVDLFLFLDLLLDLLLLVCLDLALSAANLLSAGDMCLDLAFDPDPEPEPETGYTVDPELGLLVGF